MGAGLWARSDFQPGALPFVTAALAVGGFDGALVPRLGHAESGDVSTKASQGGVLTGAGAGALLAASLATQIDVDGDMTANALTLDALFTGAGAGIGVLASKRDDAPVLGMLVAGSAGLLLGGEDVDVLHLLDEQHVVGVRDLARGVQDGHPAGPGLRRDGAQEIDALILERDEEVSAISVGQRAARIWRRNRARTRMATRFRENVSTNSTSTVP